MTDDVTGRWLELVGATLDAIDVTDLLGVAVGDLDADRVSGQILALPTGNGYAYPAWQLDNGSVRSVVFEIIAAFRDAVPAVSPYLIASWAVSPQPELNDRTPADWITEDSDDTRVVLAARRAAHLESV